MSKIDVTKQWDKIYYWMRKNVFDSENENWLCRHDFNFENRPFIILKHFVFQIINTIFQRFSKNNVFQKHHRICI